MGHGTHQRLHSSNRWLLVPAEVHANAPDISLLLREWCERKVEEEILAGHIRFPRVHRRPHRLRLVASNRKEGQESKKIKFRVSFALETSHCYKNAVRRWPHVQDVGC